MLQLTERCKKLRAAAVEQKPYVRKYAVQARVLSTLGTAEARRQGLTEGEVNAHALARVILGFRPFIAPGELVVGVNFGDGSGYGEYDAPGDNPAGRQLLAENGFSPEQTDAYFRAVAEGIRVYSYGWAAAADPKVARLEAEWSALGRDISSNHSVIGYEQVLKLGFEGLLARVEHFAAQNGDSPFYRGQRALCRAAMTLGEKYADWAESLQASGDPSYSPGDLKTVAAVCRAVPRHPAGSFREAVQAVWFAHIINTWEDTVNANSLGHLDRMLYPYYKHDLDAGILTKEEAFELVCCLWIKLYRDYDVQQSCVGGRGADGESYVSDLSYMMLDATEALNFVRCLSVRFDRNTDPAFLRRALQVVGHVQKGVPFFFNDDVMIPALTEKGIRYEDACDYTEIGCVETVIPGKSNPHAVAGEINCLKAIEYVLCNGESMMYPGSLNGVPTGPLEAFSTYDLFYEAVRTQVAYQLDVACGRVKELSETARRTVPRPYKSLLTEGCAESGRDFNDRAALYDYYQIMLSGIPNLADALAVIRQFVYEEKRYTLGELKQILQDNFPEEEVRLAFVNRAPKFGNDLEAVDSIAADITAVACRELERLSEKYGISFHAQPFTYLWMIDMGRHSAASPDGRRKGEILAYSVSPMQGRDFNGLTALFNSVSRLPTTHTPGTTSAIVEIDPKLFNDRYLDCLTDLLMGAGAQGLSNVQFNTVDAATLLDAKAHPENHKNLAVRVSGFSQKFCLLSPELQDHIICRTKHTSL